MTTRTVTIDGINLDVTFSYYAGEKANRESPGEAEEYEIDCVRLNSGNPYADLSGLFANGDALDRIVKELEKIKGDDL